MTNLNLERLDNHAEMVKRTVKAIGQGVLQMGGLV